MEKKIVSVINIGSNSIKMTIFEIINNEINILDELRQHIMLGKDSFYSGKLSRKIIDECLIVLTKFKKLSMEFNVTKILAVATTAVRESLNADIFIDNIKTKLDIDVQILSVSKEIDYIYYALKEHLPKLSEDNKHWCIIKIGNGTSQISIFKNDYIIFSRALPLGVLKMKQLYIKEFYKEENFNNFLSVMIEHELQNLKRHIPKVDISHFFAVGLEVKALAKVIMKNSKEKNQYSLEHLQLLCKKIKNYTAEEIIHKLNMPYDIAETVFPANIILSKILTFFNSKNIIIPEITLRHGMIKKLFIYNQYDKNYYQKLEKQLEYNAINIGRSLNFDEKHAIKVMELAAKLFDQTKKIHCLDNQEKCYLIVAAILHDIGSAISYRSHHKHSLYIIKEQDFYYFSKDEIQTIANIARYHRKSGPKNSHSEYISLPHKYRIIVLKIASLIRIADSLDNTHLQLIKDINVSTSSQKVTINASSDKHFFSEIYSFKYKKKLFEDIFGYQVNLNLEQ